MDPSAFPRKTQGVDILMTSFASDDMVGRKSVETPSTKCVHKVVRSSCSKTIGIQRVWEYDGRKPHEFILCLRSQHLFFLPCDVRFQDSWTSELLFSRVPTGLGWGMDVDLKLRRKYVILKENI